MSDENKPVDLAKSEARTQAGESEAPSMPSAEERAAWPHRSTDWIRSQAHLLHTQASDGSYTIDQAGACAMRVLAGRVAEMCDRADASHAAGVAEERARLDAMADEIEALRRDNARLMKREADIIEACERVADGGRYRTDIVSAINRIRGEREALRAGLTSAIGVAESCDGAGLFTATLARLRALLPPT